MSALPLYAVAVGTLMLGLTVTGGALALEAQARASGAADAAALAAADAALGWVDSVPCEVASLISESADAKLDRCDIDTVHAQVRVSVSKQTIFGTVHARARAGPPVA